MGKQVWAFLGLTFAVSWAIWLAALKFGAGAGSGEYVLAFGSVRPAAATILLSRNNQRSPGSGGSSRLICLIPVWLLACLVYVVNDSLRGVRPSSQLYRLIIGVLALLPACVVSGRPISLFFRDRELLHCSRCPSCYEPLAATLSNVHGGYDVLTPDLRCHGESGGTIASPGLLEARDILGALRYIRARGNREPVAVLGLSYGAVSSLIAASESPGIAAVISDGAFPTGKGLSEDISGHFLHDPKANFLVRVLSLMSSVPGAARATALVYYLRSGVYLGPDLLSVMPSASRIRVPVLLISGQEDWIVPTDRARQILAVLPGDQKELLVIPGAHHDTTYSTAPELYGSTVLSFLDRAIKSN